MSTPRSKIGLNFGSSPQNKKNSFCMVASKVSSSKICLENFASASVSAISSSSRLICAFSSFCSSRNPIKKGI